VWRIGDDVPDDRRADEAGPAGDEEPPGRHLSRFHRSEPSVASSSLHHRATPLKRSGVSKQNAKRKKHNHHV
jgi:hypothetical protein